MKTSVFVSGRLGQDAGVVSFKNGNSVIQFSLASSEFYKNGKDQEKTDWHQVRHYVKEVNQDLLKKLVKGAKVTIFDGRLKYSEYDKEIGGESVHFKRAYIQASTMDIG